MASDERTAMSESFELDQAVLADLINYTRGVPWDPERFPGFGELKPYQDLAWDPCTQQFVLVWGPPFVIPESSCPEDPIRDLVDVPVDEITEERLGASVRAVTTRAETVAPLLISAAALQRLAEFHAEKEHPAEYELLTAAARDLFVESLSRARSARG
jgi:hypothetical protein